MEFNIGFIILISFVVTLGILLLLAVVAQVKKPQDINNLQQENNIPFTTPTEMDKELFKEIINQSTEAYLQDISNKFNSVSNSIIELKKIYKKSDDNEIKEIVDDKKEEVKTENIENIAEEKNDKVNEQNKTIKRRNNKNPNPTPSSE